MTMAYRGESSTVDDEDHGGRHIGLPTTFGAKVLNHRERIVILDSVNRYRSDVEPKAADMIAIVSYTLIVSLVKRKSINEIHCSRPYT